MARYTNFRNGIIFSVQFSVFKHSTTGKGSSTLASSKIIPMHFWKKSKTGGFRTGFYVPEMADGKNLDPFMNLKKVLDVLCERPPI